MDATITLNHWQCQWKPAEFCKSRRLTMFDGCFSFAISQSDLKCYRNCHWTRWAIIWMLTSTLNHPFECWPSKHNRIWSCHYHSSCSCSLIAICWPKITATMCTFWKQTTSINEQQWAIMLPSKFYVTLEWAQVVIDLLDPIENQANKQTSKQPDKQMAAFNVTYLVFISPLCTSFMPFWNEKNSLAIWINLKIAFDFGSKAQMAR